MDSLAAILYLYRISIAGVHQPILFTSGRLLSLLAHCFLY